MRKYAKILFTSILLVATLTQVSAQVAQSRLNIGKNPEPKSVNTNKVASFSVKNDVPKEIKVDKNSAVTAFYRDLLLNRGESISISTVSNTVREKQNEDQLFSDKLINISNIYPNPANDVATIDYNLKSGGAAKVSFLNLLGGNIAEYDLRTGNNSLKVQTRNWENGIYFYQLILDGRKVATKKLLVRHN
ncbi:T9SS type A sorting domain-containing protein [Marinilongibacter aquaticus]|uniref:T9SS type A sorting domain-containing protein n=1 Tax=Marinilongibacter aquaticus TaxID=2975157 RepID=UPI0021BD8C4B|nr:T9SS type A sorting domain-containing protein [Marinilongibacter aquaticus]UBM58864.1 T9SS type A sorting domain-containing protein [Marinilongibacter aquaticus]